MRIYENYDVWKLAHSFILKIYTTTECFPKEEIYGLRSQIRRASASINLNIAEGCGRDSDVEFKRFLIIARGSASETEYILLLAKDLNFLTNEIYTELHSEVEHIKKKLTKLILKIDNDINSNPKQ